MKEENVLSLLRSLVAGFMYVIQFMMKRFIKLGYIKGNCYTLVEEASQNDIVALTGIKKLQAGDYIGLGHVIHSTLRPSMLYQIQPSKEADINHFFSSLKVLGEEEPLLYLKTL